MMMVLVFDDAPELHGGAGWKTEKLVVVDTLASDSECVSTCCNEMDERRLLADDGVAVPDALIAVRLLNSGSVAVLLPRTMLPVVLRPMVLREPATVDLVIVVGKLAEEVDTPALRMALNAPMPRASAPSNDPRSSERQMAGE